jgi:hypothetical protein
VVRYRAGYHPLAEKTVAARARVLSEAGAAEQGDEADEAGASDGASQLIPGVRRLI